MSGAGNVTRFFKPTWGRAPSVMGMDNDPRATAAQTRTVLDALADVLDGIREDQNEDPTPCSEFTVSDLRSHVVSWATAFGGGFTDPGGQAPDPSQMTVEGTGADQLRAAGAAIVAGIDTGGAERDLALADGMAMPGAMALAMTLWEYQVHGWDLARATGQQWSPDEDALESSLGFADRMLTPDFQGEGKAFAPRVAVADSASPLDRLMAMSGRDPQWRANG